MVALPRLLRVSRLPVFVALFAVLLGGMFLLERSDRQARDTIRKHHLEDIERSLYFARTLQGTYPPYEVPSWCGRLNDPANASVRAQVEQALRAQNEKYGNQAKPFPNDPLADRSPREALAKWGHTPDYFYWKRSPALFELYAILEAAPTGERNTSQCPTTPGLVYDYGLNSAFREDRVSFAP